MDMSNENTVDDHLSKLACSSLTICPTTEVRKVRDLSGCRLPKTRHAGLYATRLSNKPTAESIVQDSMESDAVSSAHPKNEKSDCGVPGFPDFPDSWCGEEGWAVWKRAESQQSYRAARRQKAEQIQQAHSEITLRRIISRQAVNIAGLTKSKRRNRPAFKPDATSKTKAHKKDRRRKLVMQLKHQRQMIALRRNLKALQFSK